MPITQGRPQQLGSENPDPDGASALSSDTRLNDGVSVYRNEGGEDGMGGFLDDWRFFASYKCDVFEKTPPGVSETVEGGKITSHTNWIFELPWDSEVEPWDRLLYRGQWFEIESRESAFVNAGTIRVFARRIE